VPFTSPGLIGARRSLFLLDAVPAWHDSGARRRGRWGEGRRRKLSLLGAKDELLLPCHIAYRVCPSQMKDHCSERFILNGFQYRAVATFFTLYSIPDVAFCLPYSIVDSLIVGATASRSARTGATAHPRGGGARLAIKPDHAGRV
jgi:hypothetical protein